jgi:hypothetical protein
MFGETGGGDPKLEDVSLSFGLICVITIIIQFTEGMPGPGCSKVLVAGTLKLVGTPYRGISRSRLRRKQSFALQHMAHSNSSRLIGVNPLGLAYSVRNTYKLRKEAQEGHF